MKNIFLLFLIPFSIHAQDLLETDPPLGTSFPLEEKEGGVWIPYALLISNQIVPAHAEARVLYVMPQKTDPEVAREATKAKQESAYSRPPEKVTKEIPPEILAARRIATETRWTTAQLFRLKLTNQNTTDLRFVYRIPSETDLHEVTLSFLHGLLIGQKESKVQVITVEKRSAGLHAGFLAGDEILQINGTPVEGSLAKYWEIYSAAKTKAESSSNREIQYQVKSGKDGTPLTRTLRVAASLKGSALDLF